MPWSSTEGKWWAASAIRRDALATGRPYLFLDVGAGGGTWLDVVHSALQDIGARQAWVALEVWEPSIARFDLGVRYWQVVCADVREFDLSEVPNPWAEWNEEPTRVAILGDVLEHMAEDEARVLLARMREWAELVVVSLPTMHFPQGPIDGNPYETHVEDDWSVERFLEAFPGSSAHKVGVVTSTFLFDRRPL
jgi:hypothetical protein